MSVGDVLGEAWAMYKAHWRQFVPIALAFYLALALVSLVLTAALDWVGVIVGALVSLVGIFWLQGALTEAVREVRDGRADLSIAETVNRARSRIGVLLAAGVLAILGIGLGLALLIVPGLVLLTWWSLVVPVIVIEGRGIRESFGRSRQLVRGHGWKVLGLVLLTILIAGVVSAVVGVAALLALPDTVATFVGDSLSGTLTAPFTALAWTLMYFRLRGRETAAEASPATI